MNTTSLNFINKPIMGKDLDAPENLNRVLIIDDEEENVDLLKRIFMYAGFDVLSASTGKDGVKKATSYRPDLIILDIIIPDIDGWQVLKQINDSVDIPVIVVTALSDKESVLRALRAGAEDVVTRPFDNDILVERARLILKRLEKSNKKQIELKNIDLTINIEEQKAVFRGKEIDLTKNEFAVLLLLAKRAPEPVDYDVFTGFIYKDVWKEKWKSPEQRQSVLNGRIKYIVCELRHKLEVAAGNDEKVSKLIVNKDRHGYYLKVRLED